MSLTSPEQDSGFWSLLRTCKPLLAPGHHISQWHTDMTLERWILGSAWLKGLLHNAWFCKTAVVTDGIITTQNKYKGWIYFQGQGCRTEQEVNEFIKKQACCYAVKCCYDWSLTSASGENYPSALFFTLTITHTHTHTYQTVFIKELWTKTLLCTLHRLVFPNPTPDRLQ